VGVLRGAGFVGAGGETDLIVYHDVQRAADGVTGKLAEVQRFLHDALTGE